MKILLYKTTSPNNHIDKSLSSYIEITGNLRKECSVNNPIILIEEENLSKYNYMFIEEFGRYYYINKITSIRTNLWEIEAHVDVLMTYKSQLLEHMAIIDKQSELEQSELFLDDGEWVTKNKKYIEVKNFSSGFNESGEYILITAGAIGGDVYDAQ